MIHLILGIVLIDPVYWLGSILCQVNHSFEAQTFPMNSICRGVLRPDNHKYGTCPPGGRVAAYSDPIN